MRRDKGKAKDGRKRFLVGWQLTPVVNLQPTKILESDRDGGGRSCLRPGCQLQPISLRHLAP
jgi:hypothetical protein